MTTKTVVAVRARTMRHPDGHTEPVWLIDCSHPDGTLHGYGFPHEALANRAAEYGIDPQDADTLLDILLHEPHIDLQHTDPTFLWNTDRETARTAHLDRVAAGKKAIAHADPQGLLQQIKDHYLTTFDPADHARRAAAVEAARRGNSAPHLVVGRDQNTGGHRG